MQRHSPVHALLVEDNVDQAELIRRTLARSAPPFEVTAVGDGPACLAALDRQAYAIVLLDYSLPRMDGLEVLRRIRARDASVPVVMVTGQGDERIAVEAMAAGAVDYVMKTGGYVGTLPMVITKVIKQHELTLENARLYEEVRQRLAHTETLLAVSRVTDSTLDVSEVLRRILRELVRALGADLGGAWVQKAERFVPLVGYHVPREWLDVFARSTFPADHPLVAEAVRLDGVIASADSRTDPRFDHELFRVFPHRSLLVVPIWSKGEIVGAFVVGWVRGAHRLAPEELRLVEGIARQGGIAIANAQLFEESEARRRAAEALADVGRAVSWSLEPEEVAQRITDSIRRLLGAGHSALFHLEPNGDLRVLGVSGEGAPILAPDLVFPKGSGVAGLAVLERQAIVAADVLTDPRVQLSPEARARIEAARYRAVLALPLEVNGRMVGALGVGDRAGRIFDAEDVRNAQTFADHAGLALENARLYQATRGAYEELARTQEQLTHAQKMEAVGTLAGGIAHDFNNLLTVITGRSEIVAEELGPDHEAARNVKLVLDTAERAAKLTRQLLAFSRKQVLQPKRLDLNAVVAGTVTMLRRLIGEHIDLAFMPGVDLGRIEADPAQLEQVLMNLVVNARDAMPEGGRLALKTENVELDDRYSTTQLSVRAGDYVMLSVSDTGVGMDADTRARIFEPFFTTKEPGKGTGLGLATVYGIVKQSGGHIWVYSEPDHGTSFKIYLPRVAEPAEAAAPELIARPVPDGCEVVLLVEDEGPLRELAVETLRKRGYTVLEAPTPADALRIAAEQVDPIDLLLTDVVMPQMSGRVLADRLTPAHPVMKVLYMSGYTDDAIVHHGVLDAGTAFLQKPFSPSGLARKVREVLDQPVPGPPAGPTVVI